MKQGTTERINSVLATFCSDGYGAGLIGRANIKYLLDNFRDLIYIQAVYRLGDMAQLATPIGDSRKFGELLEILAGLEDYPMIDEDYFYSMLQELEGEDIERIISEYYLNPEIVYDVLSDGDYCFGWEQDYVYPEFDEAEFAVLVREKSQSWAVHYGGEKYHEPTVCLWCLDDTLSTPL